MVSKPPAQSNFDAKAEAVAGNVLSGAEGFSAHEMIKCGDCMRSNPPDRTSCIYCGATLDAEKVRSDIARLTRQSPEPWEDGYSLVFSGDRSVGESSISAAADILEAERPTLARVLSFKAAVPLVYLRSLPEAGILASRSSAAGFDCAIVGDDLLQARTLPTRARSMIVTQTELLIEDFNTGRYAPVNKTERLLVVSGSIRRSSSELKAKIRRRGIKDVDETFAFSDEAVIDIYPPNDVYGFRVRSVGFDFSCLGGRMQATAGANVNALIDLLRELFIEIVIVDEFRAVASLLADVWPVEDIKGASAVTHRPLSGVRKRAVSIGDNTIQFTKFSRLQRHFL